MGNIKNYNFNYLDFKLSNSDYWDMFLVKDDSNNGNCDALLSGSCFVVWYDFNNPAVYSGGNIDTIYSLVTWTGATNTGYTFDTIGITGIDNGLVTFDKQSGDTTNLALLSALTGTTLIIPSGDTRLTMNRVTGTTGDYIYPMEKKNSGTFDYINFDGGFYQGFYKIDGYSYEVLPVRVEESWALEFWLKTGRDPISGVTGTTINEIDPNNNGFFFFMGARAENKFWNQWSGDCATDCITTSACTATTFCTIPRETQMSIVGDYGVPIPLSPPRIDINHITNEFLIYGRACDKYPARYPLSGNTFLFLTGGTFPTVGSGRTTCDSYNVTHCYGCGGYCFGSRCHHCGRENNQNGGLGNKTTCDYDGSGVTIATKHTIVTDHRNPFLIYGRAGENHFYHCCRSHKPSDGLGHENVCSFSGFTTPETEIDYNIDMADNALGFRILDDGSIGYRLLTQTGACSSITGGTYSSGLTINEDYSEPGLIIPDQWTYVVIKFETDYKTYCELETAHPRTGRLLYYINGKLKHIVENFDEFIAKRLLDYKDKQIGVPFNFSLGGGSQGLLESQTFGGRDPHDFDLPIQQHFAGTFIGGIAEFKFNICDLSYCNIVNNFLMGASKYGIKIISHGYCN